MTVDSLGLYSGYYSRMGHLSHFVRRHHHHDGTLEASDCDECSGVVAGCARGQWEVVLADMQSAWQTVRDVCSLLVP